MGRSKEAKHRVTSALSFKSHWLVAFWHNEVWCIWKNVIVNLNRCKTNKKKFKMCKNVCCWFNPSLNPWTVSKESNNCRVLKERRRRRKVMERARHLKDKQREREGEERRAHRAEDDWLINASVSLHTVVWSCLQPFCPQQMAIHFAWRTSNRKRLLTMARCHRIKANSDQMAFLWRSPSFAVSPKSSTVNKLLL